MCLFDVVMDGGRCFIRSIVRLGHVEKWPFLMDWRRVLRIGINSESCYHCAIYGLIMDTRELSAAGRYWIGSYSGFLVKLTFHMPDVFDWTPSNIVSPSFTVLR